MHDDISLLTPSPNHMSKFFNYFFSIELKCSNSRNMLLFGEAVGKENIDWDSFNGDSPLTT